jgi:cell volume regulation protein A
VESVNHLILIGVGLFFAAVLLSAPASRVGAPVLLVFLVIGMLAGEDGPGGIRFDDYERAYVVANLALAVILLDGGLRTNAAAFRIALRPAISLATIGVLVTAGLTGLVAAWALGISLQQGFLVGAIVGSTDAAAVFGLLHAHGMELKRRVSAVLEIESGSNDPMAIFLTLALVAALAEGQPVGLDVIPMFVQQMGLGLAAGYLGGRALAWVINRVPLAEGLYPLLALSGGLFVFASTQAAGGSGFLAIYVAGLVLGNGRLRAANNILRVHDGIAWLGQITMFLVLGLLVTPSELVTLAPAALVVATALMLVARPVAVWIALALYPAPPAEKWFISWVGLRGAVPIVLAIFPLMAGLDDARLYFNVAFFVVLVSLVCQGWTIAPLARRLGLELPPSVEALQRVELDVARDARYELLGYRVTPRSPVAGVAPAELPLPESSRVSVVIRDRTLHVPAEVASLAPGDAVYVIARAEDVERVSRTFAAEPLPTQFDEREFYGTFLLDPEAKLGDVCAVYGVAVPPGLADATLGDVLAQRFRGRAGLGDRLALGDIDLVVREVREGAVAKVGLVLRRER